MKNYQNSTALIISDKYSPNQLFSIFVLTFILFLCLFYCELVLAQEQTLIKGREDNSPQTIIDLNETGDIEITGKVKIKELRFNTVGNTTVNFPGNKERKLIDKSIRTNLPAEIKPGITYRNVEINFQILTTFVKINSLFNNYGPAERQVK